MTLYIYTQIDKIDKIDRYIMIYIYILCPGQDFATAELGEMSTTPLAKVAEAGPAGSHGPVGPHIWLVVLNHY